MKKAYIHGYNSRESIRLHDQASTLADLLHSDSSFPAGSRILEAGCGVGSQTSMLARNSQGAEIIAIDVSEASLAEAQKKLDSEGITNVTLKQGDIFRLPFETAYFDHVFVCFVLEHLPNPVDALKCLKNIVWCPRFICQPFLLEPLFSDCFFVLSRTALIPPRENFTTWCT